MSEKTKVKFIVSVFGDKFVGMLAPLLESVLINCPKSSIVVYWQDMDEDVIKVLGETYGNSKFIETNFNFSKNSVERIASKTLMWNRALLDADENSNLCFIDVDTLVLKDVRDVFELPHELFFTVVENEDHPYPINTGVVFIKNPSSAREFFKLWEEKTLQILNDPNKLKLATSRNYPYGAPDQMAIFEMVNFDKQKTEYEVKLKSKKISVLFLPGYKFNQIYSAPIKDDTKIIHYKGLWTRILLEGGDFGKKRTKKLSWEMYQYYLKMDRSSYERIHSINPGCKYKSRIVRPWYLSSDLSENETFYKIFHTEKLMTQFIMNFPVKIKSVLLRFLKH